VHKFEINLASLIPLLPSDAKAVYSSYEVRECLVRQLMPALLVTDTFGSRGYREVTFSADLEDDLLTFGLLVQRANPEPVRDDIGVHLLHAPYRLEFTDKMQRYRYWLRYTWRHPETLQARAIS
jgi:hypothetical protein